ILRVFFFFNDPPPPVIYTLSLHDALPISGSRPPCCTRSGRAAIWSGTGHTWPGRSRTRCSTCSSPSWSAPCAPPATERRCWAARSEEHTSELQSRGHLVCRLLLEKKKKKK